MSVSTFDMRGYTLVELLILILILSLLLSVIFSLSKNWIDRMIARAEVNRLVSSIRYAKFLSAKSKGKVTVRISKEIKIITPSDYIDKGKLSLIDPKTEMVYKGSNVDLAFSNGIPYYPDLTGKVKIYLKNSQIATVVLRPVTGVVRVEWGW
ncbi:hypothetical protein [Athalassotoga sp.]|uniref:hypothetical protein n=1 Tax=Athalassotoga sp. TaxID=2022597 RepID=UPI003D01A770